MKICFLNGNLNNSGGTGRVGSLIANGLSEIGHDIVMTSISGGEAPFFQLNREIKVTSLFNTPGRAISRAPLIISKLRKLLKEEKIDVLIVVESMSVLFSLFLQALLDIRTASQLRNYLKCIFRNTFLPSRHF